MDSVSMTQFKTLFEEQKNRLLYSNTILNEQFHVQPDELMDEVDQTASELEQSMRLRLRNREALFLKKIEEALTRIKEDRFGLCAECNEEIELKRLEARPTATFCVHCKEEKELQENLNIYARMPKSIGIKVRFA